MKKIALIFLTVLPLIKVIAQTPKTDAALNTQGNTIKNETNPNANTPLRVGTWMLDENASKVNNNQYAGITATGTDTYIACPTPAIISYPAFYSIKVTTTNANTGPATLSLCSLVAKNIKKIVSGALVSLVANDLCAGCSYWLMYNGTDFQILGGGSSGGGGGGGTWGTITGTLSDQSDLQSALNNKQFILIPTGVKTTTYSAVANDFIPVDVSGGSVTINLPNLSSTSSNGVAIGVKLINVGSGNNVTIQTAGAAVFNKVGGPSTFTLTNLNGTAYFQFKCTGAFCVNPIWYSISENAVTGIVNTAAANEIPKSDATNIGPSGLYSLTAGNLDLGTTSLTGDRTISAKSSSTNNSLYFQTTNGSSTATNALQLFISGTKTVVVAPPGNLSLNGSFYGGRSLIGSPFGFDFTNFPTGLSETVVSNINAPSTVLLPFRIAANASAGTPANGFGVGMEFAAQNSAGTNVVGSKIHSVFNNVTPGSESTNFVISNIVGGALTENIRFTSQGAIGLSGANFGTSGQVLTSGGVGAAASWTTVAGGGGTVSTVSVVSANGLAGTVANPTTTPAITLSTTVNGLVKGNGTAISAASAGTDYQAPVTLTTTGTSGAATFVSNTLNIPQYAGYSYSINQTAHGFTVGQVIAVNGSGVYATFAGGAGNTIAGICQTVTDANNFVMRTGGVITGLSSLTAGSVYYAQSDASLGTTATAYAIGVALTTTTIQMTFVPSFNTQTANLVFAGPSSGGPATPTFRSLVAADIAGGIGWAVTGTTTVSNPTIAVGSSIVNFTSSGANPIRLVGSASTTSNINGYYAQTSNSLGYAGLTLENNRGSLASYGQFIYGGSTISSTSLFGVTNSDKLFILADGASNTGMYMGVTGNQPVGLATNNVLRSTWGGDGTQTHSVGSTSNTKAYSFTGSGASMGMYLQGTNSTSSGETTIYIENNRGSFASYGSLYYGGSGNTSTSLFGITRADYLILFAGGASNLGMMVGTNSNTPLIFGTNNLERARFSAAGNLTVGTGNNIVGVATNNNATAGNLGEEINGIQSTYTNYTTTATYQNITSISLTAGDWDVSAFGSFSSNSATITAAANAIFVVSTTTASAAGATEGKNIAYVPQSALIGTSIESSAIVNFRVSLSGTTTYYFNTQATFTIGNPQFVGSIRARRMR